MSATNDERWERSVGEGVSISVSDNQIIIRTDGDHFGLADVKVEISIPRNPLFNQALKSIVDLPSDEDADVVFASLGVELFKPAASLLVLLSLFSYDKKVFLEGLQLFDESLALLSGKVYDLFKKVDGDELLWRFIGLVED